MSDTGNHNQYNPRPIDTSGTVVPDSLAGLLEQLATNAHDVWAAKRIREGWRFGPHRDDEAKESPWLIPYDQLPASEQEFDMSMVTETIRSIIILGYEIVSIDQSMGDEMLRSRLYSAFPLDLS